MKARRDYTRGSFAWCSYHKTSSPRLGVTCIFCGRDIHVHEDAVARAKRNSAELQRCPYCHMAFMLYKAPYGSTMQLARWDEGTPAFQLSLGMKP
jgi:hypothetical protein